MLSLQRRANAPNAQRRTITPCGMSLLSLAACIWQPSQMTSLRFYSHLEMKMLLNNILTYSMARSFGRMHFRIILAEYSEAPNVCPFLASIILFIITIIFVKLRSFLDMLITEWVKEKTRELYFSSQKSQKNQKSRDVSRRTQFFNEWERHSWV